LNDFKKLDAILRLKNQNCEFNLNPGYATATGYTMQSGLRTINYEELKIGTDFFGISSEP
jgi:hypothetical protein